MLVEVVKKENLYFENFLFILQKKKLMIIDELLHALTCGYFIPF